MNKVMASTALLALLAVGRGGLAAEATGWITHIDQKSDRFSLDDGRIFGVSEDINFPSLTDGVRVRIQYDTYGSERTVTDIELAPDAHRSGVGVPLCGRHSARSANVTPPASTAAVC